MNKTLMQFWGWVKYQWALLGEVCPNCGEPLDDNVHGYNHRHLHCHGCGWCTAGERKTCGVRR